MGNDSQHATARFSAARPNTANADRNDAGNRGDKRRLLYRGTKVDLQRETEHGHRGPPDAYAVSIQGVQGAITIDGVRPQRENYLANDRNTVTIDLSWTGRAGATFTAQDVVLTYTPPHHESDRDNKRVEDYGGIPAGNLTNYQATR